MTAAEWAAGALLLVNCLPDIRRREIYFLPTLAAGAAGVIWQFAAGGGELHDVLTGLIPGAAVLLLSFLTGGGIGAGDGIVLCAVSAWIGIWNVIQILGLALTGSFLVSIRFFVAGQRKKELPFLPFLMTGFVLWKIFESFGG